MQVALPDGVQPRRRHTATSSSLTSGLTEVTMFGGITKSVPGRHDQQPKLAETAVLQFGESMAITALLIDNVVMHVACYIRNTLHALSQ